MTSPAGTLRFADRYRVLRRLGAGGMATVYLAEDERLGRKVAVKRMHADSPEDVAKRFDREARLGASLNHPNLVAVFDTVTDDEGVLITMEYVDGPTLAQALKNGPLPVERALAILRGIASALDHAHAGGIIHRDVKPANILLGEGGRAKLADLGIAFAAEHATHLTRTGTVLGTPSYMAPEQLESREIGPEVDVYALGAVAFEALSGRRARTGSTPMEIAHRIASQPAPELREAWPEAPPAAGEALCAAMSADPAQRPRSAGELVERLAAAFEGRTADAARRAGRPASGAGAAGLGGAAGAGAAAGSGAAGGAEAARGEEPDGGDADSADEAVGGDVGAGAESAAGGDVSRREEEPVGGGAVAGSGDPARAVEAPAEEAAGAGAAADVREDGGAGRAAVIEESRFPQEPPRSGRAAASRGASAEGTGRAAARSRTPAASPATRRRPAWLAPVAVIAALGLIAALVVLVSSGGGGAGGEATRDAGTGSGAGETSTGGAGAGGDAGAQGQGAKAEPAATVKSFYELAAADDYDGAWALAGPAFRQQLGGFDAFRRTMSTLESVEFRRNETSAESGDTATVSIETVARHTNRVDRCRGTLGLARGAGGGWLIDAANVTCSNG
jgi:Protein kinase domain